VKLSLKVGILSPTTWQLVEKMGALFPEGVHVVGPLSDDHYYWNDYRRKAREWEELGLKITPNLNPFSEVDFSDYDLLIESAETFSYSRDWTNYCTRTDCPIILKACWTGDPTNVLPANYVKTARNWPVLLEMPAHAPAWKLAGFTDVNVIFNPVGDWWFARQWAGTESRLLFVLSGTKIWRGDPSWYGLDIWGKLCEEFPKEAFHHDGHEKYRTSLEMTKLFAESRVFVNLDRPYGQGERPMTLAFTEALSAGLPVIARNLPGLNYKDFIDSNGVCTNDFRTMVSFARRCLTDFDFSSQCSKRSREIARSEFSAGALRPKYQPIIERALELYNRGR
jgi:glycosyltransferase involved in cell wall biosynthesis